MKVTIAGCETNIKYIVFAEAKIGKCSCPCLSFFCVNHQRLQDHMDCSERKRFAKSGNTNNYVGLGLWCLTQLSTIFQL